MALKQIGILFGLCSLFSFSLGAIHTADHLNPTQQAQFERLIQELRCLVCQNENLQDSNAPLAKDLRNTIYFKIKQGESVQQIKQYLFNRYGQFISFKPALNHVTYILWFGPFVLLLLSCIILIWLVLRK